MSFYSYCIWDFNGTILDDVQLGMNSVNTLLAERGLPIIASREEYSRKFDFPIIDYYRTLGFDYEKESYEHLAELWVELYTRDMESAKAFSDVENTLDFFAQRGVRQTVLSASERELLIKQLNGLGLADRFEEILGIDNIYGDSKLDIARDWKARHPDEKVMFIGDTTHDVKTAEILGADCFIVCAGHQCRERFEGIDARIFDSLGKLVSYLRNL